MIFAACVAIAAAGIVPATVVTKTAVVDSEYDSNPQYAFSYGVDDAITGDSKSQVETRSGDVVHGQYSLNDADGTRRTVDYTADPINGFNAVVSKTPLVKAVAAVPVAAAPAAVAVAPQVVAARAVVAPQHVTYAAPQHVAYAAPQQVAYASPYAYAYPQQLAYGVPSQVYHSYSSPLSYYGYNY